MLPHMSMASTANALGPNVLNEFMTENTRRWGPASVNMNCMSTQCDTNVLLASITDFADTK